MGTARRYYLIIALTLGLLLPGTAQAQEPDQNRAALVVRFDEADVETYCVAFEEAEITGLELLQRSGVALVIEDVGMGVSVCSVEETGCPADDCFCQCQGGECRYWSYWLLDDGEWRYSAVGAHARAVSDGTVEGWSWGPGSVSEAISPPPVTFEEVCEAPDESPEEEVMALATETRPATEQAAAAPTVAVTPVDDPAPADPSAGNQPSDVSQDGAQEANENSLASYVLFGAIAALLVAALFAARVARRER